MNHKNSPLRRLLDKRRFLRGYTRLGSGISDKISLFKLGYGRFRAYHLKTQDFNRSWSARLSCIGNKKVYLRPTDVCHLAIFEEMFLQPAYDFSLIDFEPEFILDVGAHIGLFSLLAASRWPDATILAFEPHPDNATWARRNLSKNGLRATVLEVAASSYAGWANFDLGEGMGSISNSGESSVPTVNLPDMMRTFPFGRILVKMDIEGEEFNLLPQVLPILPLTSAVFVELHGNRQSCDDLLAQVKILGFNSQVMREKIIPDHDLYYIDLLLTRDTDDLLPQTVESKN